MPRASRGEAVLARTGACRPWRAGEWHSKAGGSKRHAPCQTHALAGAASVTTVFRQAHWPLPRELFGIPFHRLVYTRLVAGMLPCYYTGGAALLDCLTNLARDVDPHCCCADGARQTSLGGVADQALCGRACCVGSPSASLRRGCRAARWTFLCRPGPALGGSCLGRRSFFVSFLQARTGWRSGSSTARCCRSSPPSGRSWRCGVKGCRGTRLTAWQPRGQYSGVAKARSPDGRAAAAASRWLTCEHLQLLV
jgi:hypothetical protein